MAMIIVMLIQLRCATLIYAHPLPERPNRPPRAQLPQFPQQPNPNNRSHRTIWFPRGPSTEQGNMITSIRHCKAMIDAPQPLPETTCIFSLLRPQMAQDSCSPMAVARARGCSEREEANGAPLLRITPTSCAIRGPSNRRKCCIPHSRL